MAFYIARRPQYCGLTDDSTEEGSSSSEDNNDPEIFEKVLN